MLDRNFRTVIDVGANEGHFAVMARRLFPGAKLVCFEPLPDCFEKLLGRFADDRAFIGHQVALGSESREVDMHRSAFSASSSLLPMGALHREVFPHSASTSVVKVPVKTLDEVLVGVELPAPVLLKLDVQGFETEVIAGAQTTLARVGILLLEASFQQLYENEPLFDDICQSARNSGFRMVGIADILRNPKDGRPLQADVLFERDRGTARRPASQCP